MFKMSRFLGRALLGATAIGALAASSATYAQDNSNWKSVRQAGVLRCGIATSPPYTMKDPKTGTYSGVFPDLCRQFGEQVLKVKVEYVDTTWDNIVAGLQSEKWDISLSLNDTPERRKAISFSEPVVDYSVTFTYNKNNPKVPKQIQSIADIDKPGTTVTVMSGTAQDKAISAVLKQATIMRLPGFDETRLALMSKRADLLADDNMTNLLLTRAHPDWAEAFKPNPLLAQQGIAFGIRKDTPAADVAVLNQFIEKQKQSGAVNTLVDASVKQTVAATK
ncbi:amino acid ABC transporter substrate-binding protein [Burkholderia sp. KK1]|uniref:Extracellular solute-binding protein n=1 Tax=Caballeronia cordobensis TaxID=1353886 RepID=A0A158HMX0_CABCO|nr:transporter substrate-binding domain-containing protein [Caballeronia cordobensis]AET92711.1 extracellular solute-binding protein [Burkholderia sp. YI23]AQH02574.1 amino acid ABC transporter substrate-binding protein [Burkholderia sp. KK1]SAL45427.1 extracellular solute-binding protein [Caballeronia cordobensis]